MQDERNRPVERVEKGGVTLKDVTSTSFGLVIGFLLPGVAALYSLAPWSPTLNATFEIFKQARTDIGLSILGLLSALTAGLMLSLVRWLIFERGICRNHEIGPAAFRELSVGSDRLAAFRAAVDEYYRYHQFWGGMALVLPLLYADWVRSAWSTSQLRLSIGTVIFAGIEALTVYGAVMAFKYYVYRSQNIMRGA